MIDIDGTFTAASEDAAALRRLATFVGKWRTAGQSFAEGQRVEEPRGSPVPWTSDESYAWLPGGHFLLHRWDAMVGAYAFTGTQIIGFDTCKGGYFSHLFDNAWNHSEYRGECDAGAWKFRGVATRSVTKISPDAQTMDVAWEWMNGGRQWLPLCERRATRVT